MNIADGMSLYRRGKAVYYPGRFAVHMKRFLSTCEKRRISTGSCNNARCCQANNYVQNPFLFRSFAQPVQSKYTRENPVLQNPLEIPGKEGKNNRARQLPRKLLGKKLSRNQMIHDRFPCQNHLGDLDVSICLTTLAAYISLGIAPSIGNEYVGRQHASNPARSHVGTGVESRQRPLEDYVGKAMEKKAYRAHRWKMSEEERKLFQREEQEKKKKKEG